ncbi:MAG: hypothetical protein FWF63_05250 [Fibromonadales bacterium]|nr:hypothetical protein [Fibromonadales bacterium]
MKFKAILVVFSLLLSCQGPWSYYPENPENYRGIWISAYLVSGRPVKNKSVCLEKMHNLNEVYMRGFAFYDRASIEIKGLFNGRDTSIFLKPDTADFAHRPNCFVSDENLIPEAGANYDMYVSVTWDSAGIKTTSEFSAKTHIPKKFKIKKAYDLLGEQFRTGDTIMYLPPPMDMGSIYFIPEYSNEDIGGTLVSMVYDTSGLYWGENFIDKLAEQFDSEGNDTLRHVRFGDRRLLYTATNAQIANMNKDIDSIPIMGSMVPAIGNIKFLFYATTREYINYRSTFLQGSGNSRINPIYNIEGGAGIFAGMLVDTFEVSLKTTPDLKTYSYSEAQASYCLKEDEEYKVENWRTHSQCLAFWEKIPTKDYMSDLLSWCEMQYFPIDKYPDCGTALVYFYKTGRRSPILEREVKKWCEEHKSNAECS